MEQSSFEQLLRESFHSLSSGQKKVAEYLLKNIEKAAFSTAEQIGRETQVSQTTVIRLSYALGFSGFSEMQTSIQQQLLTHSTPLKKPNNHKGNPFSKVIEKDIAILQEMLNRLNEEYLWKAIDWLIEADQILVVGYRSSHGAAQWFSFGLSEIRDNIHVSSNIGETLDKVLSLSEKSVTFVISYPRYTREALTITECAKEHGSKIIALTDHLLSPVGRLSDLIFTTEKNLESGTNSIASILSFLNLILTGMITRLDGEIQDRRKELEKLYSSVHLFVE